MLPKSYRFSEDVVDKISWLCNREKITQSALLEKLVVNYYEQIIKTGGDEKEPLEKIAETLRKEKMALNSVDKKVTYLLDVMNSFITTGVTVDDESFTPADDEPHSWIRQSKMHLSQKITELQYNKHV